MTDERTARSSSEKGDSDGNKVPEFLSPVSKLELARRYAAEEQQKRIEATNARLVNKMKQRSLKRKQTERIVEEALNKRLKMSNREDMTKSSVSDSEQMDESTEFEISRNSTDSVVESTTISTSVNVSIDNAEDIPSQLDFDDQRQLISEFMEENLETKELLRSARMKLDRLAANSLSNHSTPTSLQTPGKAAMQKELHEEQSHSDPSAKRDGHDDFKPLTNFHLRQMGCTSKVDIYAPVAEQHQRFYEVNPRSDVESIRTVHKRIEFKSPSPEREFLQNEYEDEDSEMEFLPFETREARATSPSSEKLSQHSGRVRSFPSTPHMSKSGNSRVLPQTRTFWVPIYMFSTFIMVLSLLLALDFLREYSDEIGKLWPFLTFF